MNDRTISRSEFHTGDDHKEMSDKQNRRAYAQPALKRHEKLPVITAGSISEESWKFENGNPSD